MQSKMVKELQLLHAIATRALRGEDTSINDIHLASKTYSHLAATSVALNKLRVNGFIQYEEHGDRRKSHVDITDLGEHRMVLLAQWADEHGSWLQNIAREALDASDEEML
jgi:DNA-binding MarR family transcriptional regulator